MFSENTQNTENTSVGNSIVTVNNTEELTSFIKNFVEKSSNTRLSRRGDEKGSLDTLSNIRDKLKQFISNQEVSLPKAFVENSRAPVKEEIERIIAEKEQEIQDTLAARQTVDDNPAENAELSEADREPIHDIADQKDEIIEVYINGNLQDSSEEEVLPGAIYTNGPPRTPHTSSQAAEGLLPEAVPISQDDYYYDDYPADYQDAPSQQQQQGSGSFPTHSLSDPPQLAANHALTSLNNLFQRHAGNPQATPQDPQNSLPMQYLTQLQDYDLPDSDTLNIILTPNVRDSSQPNIAILPTSDLPRISSNISADVGVDIEAILKSLAGSAASIRQQPMIVEENHTQLIKQPGMPTKLKIKETMSEILGHQQSPKVTVLSNREQENSFQDLETMIRQVMGEASGASSPPPPVEIIKLTI